MSLKQLFLVLAVFACLNYHGLEARGFAPNRPEINADAFSSLLGGANGKANILDLILKSRGTTLEEIHDKIAQADGNVEGVVGGLNSAIKGDLARIDGDSVRFNPEEIKTLLKDGLHEAVRRQFGNNPFAASILESNINREFSRPTNDFSALIESKPIPVEALSSFLQTHQINRQRRSLQSRDLGQAISDIVLSLVRDQFSSIIYDLLETLKNTLIDLKISISPNGSIDNVLGYAVNTLVDGGIQLIAEIQENIRPTVTTTVSPASRRKRQADDATTEGSDNTDVDDNSGGGGGGLTDILKPILNLLLLLLSPVRLLLELLVNGLLTVLSPILGEGLTGVLRNLGQSIIDALMPI